MKTGSPQPYYTSHGPWTDPGRYAPEVDELPGDIDALIEVVRGLLIHDSWLHLYALTTEDMPTQSRDTLPVAQRLEAALAPPADSLSCARPPARRAIATCRDYALMLCSFLRQKEIPARVRCGFASYFDEGRYEDHWVCEYWHTHDRRWARSDAQLDMHHRAHFSINFNTTDLPAADFLSAGEAWRHFRSRRVEASVFGHGPHRGEWFMRINLARDLLALCKREVSEWDTWREAPAASHHLDGTAEAWCDEIAALTVDIDRHLPDREGEWGVPLRPFWRL